MGFDHGRHAPIASEDQARLIAHILVDPKPHVGKTYPLYGPKEYTFEEAFAEISRILGYRIDFQRIPLEQYGEAIASFSPFLAQHTVEVVKNHDAGLFAGTDVIIEKTTGVPPMGLEAFIKANMAAYERA